MATQSVAGIVGTELERIAACDPRYFSLSISQRALVDALCAKQRSTMVQAVAEVTEAGAYLGSPGAPYSARRVLSYPHLRRAIFEMLDTEHHHRTFLKAALAMLRRQFARRTTDLRGKDIISAAAMVEQRLPFVDLLKEAALEMADESIAADVVWYGSKKAFSDDPGSLEEFGGYLVQLIEDAATAEKRRAACGGVKKASDLKTVRSAREEAESLFWGILVGVNRRAEELGEQTYILPDKEDPEYRRTVDEIAKTIFEERDRNRKDEC